VYGLGTTFGKSTAADVDEHLTIPVGCSIGGACGHIVSSGPSIAVDHALTYLGYRERTACRADHQRSLTPLPGGDILGSTVSEGQRLHDVNLHWFALFRRSSS
jgi:hypothetical protein